VREAEEVEALGLAPSVPLPVLGRITAEFEEAGLCGVQLQSELREALREVGPEPPGFCLVLKAHDAIVGIADDDHIAFCLPPPRLSPEVQHVVEIDVGEQR
jgi:hypothetical protein